MASSPPAPVPAGPRTRPVARCIAAVGLFALAGATVVGCSSASASSSTSSLCTSVESLQHSASKLRDMQISENGVAAMRDQLGTVKGDVNKVITEARAHYGPQADRIRSYVDTLRAAAGQVRENPTADTLAAVKPTLTTLVTDIKTLVDQVGNCA
jgi:uncharacterized alpha-E superfamily protein